MTLNMFVTSRWGIFQSSDFRLTTAEGNSHTLSNSEQKMYVLHYWDWSGVLSYTGVARYRRHDTAAWLSRVLVHKPGPRTFNEVLHTLELEGQRWIKTIPERHRRHTFTLAAYVKKRPVLGYVSTFERAGGYPLERPKDRFFTTIHRPRGGPRFFATGVGGSYIEVDDRDHLRNLVSRSAPNEDVRRAFAEVNARAALNPKAATSEQCIASHLLPNGSGEAQVFGELSSLFLPALIVTGSTAFEQDVPPGHTIRGVTWTNNGYAAAMLAAYRPVAIPEQ